MNPLADRIICALTEIVGAGNVAIGEEAAPYLVDERRRYQGISPLVMRPVSVDQISKLVRLCSEQKIGIVPQGGNTSLVGGSVPDASGQQILVSLSRLNRIRSVDAANYTITVEAGCILADVQDEAARVDRLFPLSLAAEGSCQIGGNLSTNAGGTSVLRYGNARDLVLGLEVVLANGEVWQGLRGVRKDNTGYDLKQLFIGAEGTLGITTAATLRLFPRPREVTTCLVAVADPEAAGALLSELRGVTGDRVSAFEYMHRACIEMVSTHIDDSLDPFARSFEHYVLVEIETCVEAVEGVFGEMLNRLQVLDAVFASSCAQAQRLWRLREAIPEAQKHAGGGVKHDIAVPIVRVSEFLVRARDTVRQKLPNAVIVAFGHLGDGNIHYNLSLPPGELLADFAVQAEPLVDAIHELAIELGGTFSAEHGIGQLRKSELERYRSATELQLMRAVKRALDPLGIMNPGKLFDV